MVKTKGIEATMQNYQSAIGTVPGKYKAGVERNTNWQERAVASENLYAARVQESIANRSRAKALSAVSNEEWKKQAAEKGSARIASGMNASIGKMRSKMGEVLSTIESTTIGERTADPMANIDNRVKPIAKALYDAKRR